jgi:hypothetical protein
VKLQYISIDVKIEDILTKTLAKGKFAYFRGTSWGLWRLLPWLRGNVDILALCIFLFMLMYLIYMLMLMLAQGQT